MKKQKCHYPLLKTQTARPHAKQRRVKWKGSKNCKNCAFTNSFSLLRILCSKYEAIELITFHSVPFIQETNNSKTRKALTAMCNDKRKTFNRGARIWLTKSQPIFDRIFNKECVSVPHHVFLSRIY